MAVMRDRPYGNARFLVDLGVGDPRSAAAGFCEVVLPTMRLADAGEPAPEAGHLVLRRGFNGALDLYAWWSKGDLGEAPSRRTVQVQLLDDAGEQVVATWRFRQARPVSLSYSPLDALRPAVLIETLEVAFDSVELV